MSLEEMAAYELKQRQATKDNAEDGDDAGDLSDHNHEDDEEVDDYVQDYYASEEESDGGGGEATF